MKKWGFGIGLLAVCGFGRAGTITTSQSGVSQVEIGGVTVVDNNNAVTDGQVSVQALWGSLTTPEARTAARAGQREMAVNAKFDDHNNFSRTDFSLVLSQANYEIHVGPDTPFVTEAAIDFVLPLSYLEVTSNAELRFLTAQSVLLADLRVCQATACTSADSVFHFQANLDASFSNFGYSQTATGHPSLDLSSLRNPAVRDVQTGSHRTTTVEYPLFHGHVDLGRIPAGSPVTVEYVMQARVWGLGDTNIAISAINDPFLLETDPVHQYNFAELTLTPADADGEVPEPGSAALCLGGLAMLAFAGIAPALRRAAHHWRTSSPLWP